MLNKLINEIKTEVSNTINKKMEQQKIEIQKINQNINSLDKNVKALRNDVNTLKVDVNTLKVDMNTLKADVNTLKADVNTLKADVNTLKADVNTLKTEVNTLKTDMKNLDKRVTKLEINSKSQSLGQTNSLKTDSSNLDGGDLVNFEFSTEKHINDSNKKKAGQNEINIKNKITNNNKKIQPIILENYEKRKIAKGKKVPSQKIINKKSNKRVYIGIGITNSKDYNKNDKNSYRSIMTEKNKYAKFFTKEYAISKKPSKKSLKNK